MAPLARRAAAEGIGTAILLGTIVGSGIMAQQLSDDAAIRLLINAFATSAVLVAIILSLGPVSGAHVNPAVTLVDRWFGGLSTRDAVAYVAAQVTGGLLGVVGANLMFRLEPVTIAATERSGAHLWFAEVVATFGLVLVIFGVVRSSRPDMAAFVVGAYIAAAFFFTSSTSFANPAVAIGRVFSDTFAGITPSSAVGFVVAQAVGAALVIPTIRFMFPDAERAASAVVVAHDDGGLQ